MPIYHVTSVVMTQPAEGVMNAEIARASAQLDAAGVNVTHEITGGVTLNLDAEFDVPAGKDANQYIIGRLRELDMSPIMPLFPKLTSGSLLDTWRARVPADADPRRLSRPELCQVINKGPSTVGRLTREDGMPHAKDGNQYFYDIEQVASWAAGRWDF